MCCNNTVWCGPESQTPGNRASPAAERGYSAGMALRACLTRSNQCRMQAQVQLPQLPVQEVHVVLCSGAAHSRTCHGMLCGQAMQVLQHHRSCNSAGKANKHGQQTLLGDKFSGPARGPPAGKTLCWVGALAMRLCCDASLA